MFLAQRTHKCRKSFLTDVKVQLSSAARVLTEILTRHFLKLPESLSNKTNIKHSYFYSEMPPFHCTPCPTLLRTLTLANSKDPG